MNPSELPVPTITPEAAPYWEGARRGKLLLQRCGACGALRFYPRTLCPSCWSDRVEWTEASGRGSVHSFTVIHRAPTPAFASQVPYVVALIDLQEGPRMMANVIGDGARDLRIDDAVRVTFEQRAGGFMLPQFVRVMSS
jgi:uncharacterized OB-fold protein